MPLQTPETFDPSRPLVARRPFSAGGRNYANGDPFDWRRMAVSLRRVRQLFDAGYVRHPREEMASSTSAAASETSVQTASETPHTQADHAGFIGETHSARDSVGALLAQIDTMSPAELKAVAERLGAPVKFRADAQRAAIRDFLGASG